MRKLYDIQSMSSFITLRANFRNDLEEGCLPGFRHALGQVLDDSILGQRRLEVHV